MESRGALDAVHHRKADAFQRKPLGIDLRAADFVGMAQRRKEVVCPLILRRIARRKHGKTRIKSSAAFQAEHAGARVLLLRCPVCIARGDRQARSMTSTSALGA